MTKKNEELKRELRVRQEQEAKAFHSEKEVSGSLSMKTFSESFRHTSLSGNGTSSSENWMHKNESSRNCERSSKKEIVLKRRA